MKSAQLQDQLLEAIDKDTEAFNVVIAVFDLPKKRKKRKSLVEAMQSFETCDNISFLYDIHHR